MSSEKCLCRSPTHILKLGYLDEFLGNSIVQFCEFLMEPDYQLLVRYRKLSKTVNDNVLYKS